MKSLKGLIKQWKGQRFEKNRKKDEEAIKGKAYDLTLEQLGVSGYYLSKIIEEHQDVISSLEEDEGIPRQEVWEVYQAKIKEVANEISNQKLDKLKDYSNGE